MTRTTTARSAPSAADRKPRRTAPRRIAAGRRLFGRYRIERRLGRGGSAEVWLAHDERLGRTVAIKAPLPDALPDAAARERFINEARAAAGLSHPGIVAVYDVVADPATPALVLRYVDGETLAARLANGGPLAPGVAAGIAADLAGALAHAHAAGIVHRDVKPGNVLLDRTGHAQLLDFGIAGTLAEGPEATDFAEGVPRTVLGTLRYMAPEHLRGGPIDARSDLYALGLVLHEMLAGRSAYEPDSPEALAAAQLAGPAALPSTVPASLRALVKELLALDPVDRPASAAEVESRLLAAARDLPDVSAGGADTPVAPTIAAGLPAAGAGLALLTADPVRTEGAAPDPASDRPLAERDTAMLQVPATAEAPAAVIVPQAPRAANADPRRAPPAPVQATPRRRWVGPVIAAAGAALLVVGIALGAGLGALGQGGAAAGSAGAPAADLATPGAAPATPATAPQGPAPKPPNGHHGGGHGHGKGGGG